MEQLSDNQTPAQRILSRDRLIHRAIKQGLYNTVRVIATVTQIDVNILEAEIYRM